MRDLHGLAAASTPAAPLHRLDPTVVQLVGLVRAPAGAGAGGGALERPQGRQFGLPTQEYCHAAE